MQSYPEKMQVKVASPNRTKINLSGDVYSTSDFGILKPIFCREALPGDSFNLNISSFTRLAPMPVPPFAQIRMFNRAFYVLMRNIWRGWEAFIKGAPSNEAGISDIPIAVPTIQNDQICSILIESTKFTRQLGTGHVLTPDADFVYGDSVSTRYPYKFTPLGKKLYDVLISLGYSINFSKADTTKMSLLPLLAYSRIYFDYFIPSQYKESWEFSYYFSLTTWNYQQVSGFFRAFTPFFSFLQNDYFTSAWVSPYGPSTSTGLALPRIDGQNWHFGRDTGNDNLDVLSGQALGARISPHESYAIQELSATGIKTLQAMQNYLNRKMIAGTQYYEFLRSTFGVHIPDAIINRSQYIGTSTVDIQISDVTATSASGEGDTYQPLGDYAGKGIGYDKGGNFHVECNEHGFVIVLSNILPHTGYYQGRNRELQHISRLDFFTPEFENTNVQAIRNDELYAEFLTPTEYDDGQNYGGKPDGIFGYAPRYAEYKKGNDIVSGDFRLHSLSGQDYNAWHLMRRFTTPNSAHPIGLNSSFMSADPFSTGNDFDRIFQYTADDTPDHFITVHHIECTAMRKMHSISESIDTVGSETISVQTQGSRLS